MFAYPHYYLLDFRLRRELKMCLHNLLKGRGFL